MRKRPVQFLFPIAGRQARLDAIVNGDAPADFFYGGLHLEQELGSLGYVDLRKDPAGKGAQLLLLWERLRNRYTNFGPSRQRVSAFADDFQAGDLILSFTDSGSLSIGLHRDLLPDNTILAGGFHGLCDMTEEVAPWARGWAESKIRKGLHGLDHCFFFGEKDREVAIQRFGLDPARTSIFPFGIDLDFWHPGAEADREKDGLAFAVGSDPKRDYACLAKAAGTDFPVRILTRLGVDKAADQDNLDLVSGSLHGSAITDTVLRELYWQAEMVVVPIRDVIQPSGYSVSLQAMACGRPVIVSDIRGLWDRVLFRDGENCLLVPPGDAAALRRAMDRLHGDPGLRQAMGQAALETAREHFGLPRMNQGLSTMVNALQERYAPDNNISNSGAGG